MGVGGEGVEINRGFKENNYGVGSAGTPRHCRAWLGSRWLRGRKGTGKEEGGRRRTDISFRHAFIYLIVSTSRNAYHTSTQSPVKALSSRLAGPQSQVFFSGPLAHNTCAVSKPNPLRNPDFKRDNRPVVS